MDYESHYFNPDWMKKNMSDGKHRDAIGGMWDVIGSLQCQFLISVGLEKHHQLIDVGCGSLRGGVKIAEYLNNNCYFGLDINESLINSGYEKELIPLGLDKKVPRENLIVSDVFDFNGWHDKFDFAIGLSLFTHLKMNSIRLCLEKLHPAMKNQGKFYATIFETNETPSYKSQQQTDGLVTYGYGDPYHYFQADLEYLAKSSGWKFNWIGDFNHPRNQKMALFIKEN